MKFRLTACLLLHWILHSSLAAPIASRHSQSERRGASFASLKGLTTLNHDASSYKTFSSPNKFFHEANFSPHYDGRFAQIELSHGIRTMHLRLLLKSYLDTMQRLGIRTWLMHGCLLGWWWNAQIMPWDADVDMMVDENGVKELGSWWNMTVHHFTADELQIPTQREAAGHSEAPNAEEEGDRARLQMLHEDVARHGKRYLLEVNPFYSNMSTRDRENIIDARWIDTSTGLFIDITTVHVQPMVEDSSNVDWDEYDIELYTKDQHAYSFSEMFPLRATTFEGLSVHVPYNYEQLLLDEYGYRSITHKWYRGWLFDDELHEWIATAEAMSLASLEEQRESQDRKSFFEKFRDSEDA